ncbi:MULTISPECIES: transcription factor S [Acidiplasma]|jgi:DNA-directed RNA polymerase subunit M|uniref:Transcription factor S n=2 Tax=Acidiplasma TaxID=507753 RepID=A0A0Q0VVV2_9ARCH|nr:MULTISPECIES: transcription factor S [Acidiplasma]KJE49275.1 DNA-directed RNA polymerase subunit M [Acidiplasma sp. MBA-1]KPV46987.1 DNA-directed RNA polymerase subunit M [Acidiplasma aeolicum]KQB34338.1 DNA-directed RNA polymerase subunit M [Acidiplasma aeolicum]KQB35763.1 DNA-directed RNA polymerase subunit M [Acidiplasma cupricumulans]WMT54749.1 MAG: transcription factor S [Acidiplasma sp.]
MFCPKCGSLMVPNKDKYICNNCGYEVSKSGHNEKITAQSSGKETIMIEEEVSGEPLDSEAVCPKCGHVGAYYLLKQTRSADEPETKFYTCEACHHRWREY